MAAAVAAVLVTASGVAYASIPDSNTGVISGCYKTSNPAKGALTVIDAQAGDTCPTGTTPLNWYQGAPPEITVIANSISVDPGASFTVLAYCPSGTTLTGGGYLDYVDQSLTVTTSAGFKIGNSTAWGLTGVNHTTEPKGTPRPEALCAPTGT